MSIKIYYQNVRGVRTKWEEFYLNLFEIDADIICITESWLNSNFNCGEFIHSNYISHRRDRDYTATNTSRGGGCWILHKSNIFTTRIRGFETNIPFLEDIWLSIKMENGHNLYVCTVYITPKPDNTELYDVFMAKLIDNMSQMTDQDRLVILGDFNLSEICWELAANGDNIATNAHTVRAKDFINCMNYCNIRQHNLIHNAFNRVLDLVLSNDPYSACTVTRSPHALVPLDNYHPALWVEVPRRLSYARSTITRKYNFRRANFEDMSYDIGDTDWGFLETMEINSALDVFYEKINSLIDKHTPLRGKGSKYPMWFSRDLRHCLELKDKYRRDFKRSNSGTDYTKYSELRTKCKKMTRQCHKAHIASVQSNMRSNIKLFWKFTKDRKQTNTYPSVLKYEGVTANSPQKCCDLFAKYFKTAFPINNNNPSHTQIGGREPPYSVFGEEEIGNILQNLDENKNGGPDGIPNLLLRRTYEYIARPLTIIYNRSIRLGTFPERFKQAYITPIFKKGDNTLVENYRPVCLLNTMSLVLERAVYNRLYPIISSKISPQQHGFTRNKSTTTNLAEYTSYISSALDKNIEVHSVYTDFSKAFDTVSHPILLTKLRTFDLSPTMIEWFASYIKNRELSVRFNGRTTSPFLQTIGVPQGSTFC